MVQDNGLVPIVEPEMTLGEGEYTIEDTSYWSERVLTHVFRHLNEQNVMLEGILMKPSMCLPGQPAALYCNQHMTPIKGMKVEARCMVAAVGIKHDNHQGRKT